MPSSLPPPASLAAALSLIAAMTLTGANVAFGRAIAAECPIYAFLLFRFLVASAALAPLAHAEPGPRLGALTWAMTWAQRRDLVLMALLGIVGFTVLMLGTWYALSSSVLCLWLWYRGLPHVPTWLAGLATAAVPVAALATAALNLQEAPGLAQLAGAALVIAAIVLCALAPPRRHNEIDEAPPIAAAGKP